MSADGSTEFEWADGRYRFRLAIGQLRELQEKCGCGPAELSARISQQRWMVDDLREIIRLGLIGGGKSPADALKLVRRYVEERPLLESVPVAMAVLLTALVGVPDDPVGKKPAEGTATEPATSSFSPQSTERVLQ